MHITLKDITEEEGYGKSYTLTYTKSVNIKVTQTFVASSEKDMKSFEFKKMCKRKAEALAEKITDELLEDVICEVLK